jgi:transposase
MLHSLEEEIAALDRAIAAAFKRNERAKRLATIPGVGVLIAHYVATLFPDASVFSGGREFAAYLGLVPRQNSTAGKARLGRISKMGNRDLRSLLYTGAVAVLWRLRDVKNTSALALWARKLLATKRFGVVAVALANKMARTIWAVLARGGEYVPGFKPACALQAA